MRAAVGDEQVAVRLDVKAAQFVEAGGVVGQAAARRPFADPVGVAEVGERLVVLHPQAAAAAERGADVGLGMEERAQDAVGGDAADAGVVGVEHIHRAVGAHPEGVGGIELQRGCRGGAFAIEAADVRAGVGVKEAVGVEPQDGVAVLVGDVNVPCTIGQGPVRAREGDERTGSALEVRLPVTGVVHPPGTVTREGFEVAVGVDEIGEAGSGGGNPDRAEAEETTRRAGRHGETAGAGEGKHVG